MKNDLKLEKDNVTTLTGKLDEATGYLIDAEPERTRLYDDLEKTKERLKLAEDETKTAYAANLLQTVTGEVFYQGKWMPFTELMQEKGYSQLNNEWRLKKVPPAPQSATGGTNNPPGNDVNSSRIDLPGTNKVRMTGIAPPATTQAGN